MRPVPPAAILLASASSFSRAVRCPGPLSSLCHADVALLAPLLTPVQLLSWRKGSASTLCSHFPSRICRETDPERRSCVQEGAGTPISRECGYFTCLVRHGYGTELPPPKRTSQLPTNPRKAPLTRGPIHLCLLAVLPLWMAGHMKRAISGPHPHPMTSEAML